MLSTRTLVLESVPGNVSDRPRAIRFEAGVGDEIIDFEPAVLLEGKVNETRQQGYICILAHHCVSGETSTCSLVRQVRRVTWLAFNSTRWYDNVPMRITLHQHQRRAILPG